MRPLCVGKHDLFDSIDRRDHFAARALCAQCPALAWCAQRAEALKRQHTYCRPLTGTWAGRLYGRPHGGIRKDYTEDLPDYTDAELRAFHAAYRRGERDETTKAGERMYQRLRKSRNRTEKVAA